MHRLEVSCLQEQNIRAFFPGLTDVTWYILDKRCVGYSKQAVHKRWGT